MSNEAKKQEYVECVARMAADQMAGGISYSTFLSNLKICVKHMDQLEAGLRPGCCSMAESRRMAMEERPSIDPRHTINKEKDEHTIS